MGGSLIYAVLTLFLTPRVAILVQVVMPILMLVAYLFILTTPNGRVTRPDEPLPHSPDDAKLLLEPPSGPTPPHPLQKVKVGVAWLRDQARYIPNLFQYMVPLFVVFAAEYMINQGLFELLYYRNTSLGTLCLDGHLQYRW